MPPCGGHRKRSRLILSQLSFKSCPRVGGIFCWISSRAVALRFKSCPRVGGIHAKRVFFPTDHVSSRAPVWGASGRRAPTGAHHGFQVVPPCGGHHRALERSIIPSQFQVVPPCGGHQILIGKPMPLKMVSSRAPVWGASIFAVFREDNMYVSSRAPVWGASRNLIGGGPACPGFKSCPRVGGIRQ